MYSQLIFDYTIVGNSLFIDGAVEISYLYAKHVPVSQPYTHTKKHNKAISQNNYNDNNSATTNKILHICNMAEHEGFYT